MNSKLKLIRQNSSLKSPSKAITAAQLSGGQVDKETKVSKGERCTFEAST